jgi:sialate O-acetylesterase
MQRRLLALTPIILAARGLASMTPASVFSDHMVLQRDMQVPVWGMAAPGEKVTATFAGKSASSVAGSDGSWRLKLGPFAANDQPGTLILSSDRGAALEIKDVLVGEVWVGSGQSNMQLWTTNFIGRPSDPRVSTVADQNLQALVDAAPYPTLRLIASAANNTPLPLQEIRWRSATKEALTQFSAQLSAMGVELQKQLHVPVGLMLSAIGGSPSCRWVTPAALAADPACQEDLAKAMTAYHPEKEQADYEAALAKYHSDQAAWDTLPDGQKAGKKPPNKPNPPVKPGEPLRWAVGDLHEQVLAPFIGYGIRGILWDQGESGAMIRGIDQHAVMGALFKSWRQEWGQGDLPFVLVSKPSGGGCAFDPADKVNGWAADPFQPLPPNPNGNGKNHEDMARLGEYRSVFLVPVCDLGGGLHPMNKFAYGARDARVILGAVYGLPIEWSGPLFDNAKVEGGKIRIHFTHTKGGLVPSNGQKLQGFAISGSDRKFIWADAEIQGDDVLVSSPSVTNPTFVRYAWDGKHPWANLFNGEGLPARPFRTDS